MWKKILCALASAAVIAGLAMLYVTQTADSQQSEASLKKVNTEIRALQTEKETLEAQLAELEAGKSGQPQAVLCFSSADERLYTDIFPVLQSNGLTGIMILRNGELPGDRDMPSAEQFLEMIHAGWGYAIMVTQYSGNTDEAWQSSIREYMNELSERVEVKPAMYCFNTGDSESKAEILRQEGFEVVLTHEQGTVYDGLQVIHLLPYNADSLTDTILNASGYCGLEMWIDWNNNTPDNLRYSDDRFAEVLNDSGLKIINWETLTSESEQGLDEESIRSRLAEIEREMDKLYN